MLQGLFRVVYLPKWRLCSKALLILSIPKLRKITQNPLFTWNPKFYQNMINENVRFWLVRLRGLKLGRPVSVVWFDSNAMEMTTAEHYIHLTKFCVLLACPYYSLKNWNLCLEPARLFNYFDYSVSNLQELSLPAQFWLYENWSLHHSKSKGLKESQAES